MIVRGTVDVSSKAVSSTTTVTGMASAPVAVIFYARTNTLSATSVSGSVGSEPAGPQFGVLTASGQFALSSSRDAGGTDVDRRHASGLVHVDISATGGSFSGALTSDGFTLTCTEASGTNNHLHYLAIGGAGVTAQVGTITAPSSPSVVDYNLGMKPHMLLHWTLGTHSDSGDAVYRFGMGAIAYDLTQGSVSVSEGTTSYEYCTDEEGFGYVNSTSATLLARGTASWLPAGVRVDWTEASSQVFHYLAVRGVTTQLVGVASAASLNGIATVSGMPWQPDAGYVFSSLRNSANFHTPGTPVGSSTSAKTARFSVGAWCSPTDRSFQGFNVHGAPPSLNETFSGLGRVGGWSTQVGGSQQMAIDIDAINSDGFDYETVQYALTGQRPFATLAFLDRAPRENIFPPPHIGAP